MAMWKLLRSISVHITPPDRNKIMDILLLTVFWILVSPAFAQTVMPPIQFSVIEEANNTYVGDISSSPLLVNRYPSVIATFKYEKSINPNQDQTLFSLNRDDGVVRTAKPIDREKYCVSQTTCSLFLDVTIVEPSQYIQVLTLQVEIIDENDNPPVFDQTSLEVLIIESAPVGTKRPILSEATDRDSPSNGVNQEAYVFQSNIQGVFGVQKDSTGLNLVLEQELNREDISSYTLKLLAYDKGSPPKSASITINVIVTDDNDNPPVFSQPVYPLQVSEDFPLQKNLMQVSTSDADSGVNAQVTYSLGTLSKVNFGSVFAMNASTGSLYLKSTLDYESQTEYILEVVATDGGSNSQTSTCKINVTVTDVNDIAPQVKINTLTNVQSAQIEENLPVGQFIAFVRVSDGDSGVNGQVTCTLNHPSFQLNSLSGKDQFKVTTSRSLDREDVGFYSITVICTDSGSPQLKGNGTVSVVVLDQNDHSPVFTPKSYSVTVEENSNIGSLVVQVSAKDGDIEPNSKITYSITNSLAKQYLEINPNDGTIRVAQRLDYETLKYLLVSVLAQDGGSSPNNATASVNVTITDVNDQPPIFTQSTFVFNISEASSRNSAVGKVDAVDPDSTGNNLFTYSLDSQGDAASFNIHPQSGQLTTNTLLDREAKDSYNFMVHATDQNDGRLTSSSSVVIHILDTNDNAPKIIYPATGKNSTVLEISNKVPVGYKVMQISATDADAGINGTLQYLLYGDSADSKTPRFIVNRDTGVILTNKDLSRDDYKVMSPTIVVRDGGVRPLTASATMTIVINSNTPYVGPTGSGQAGGDEPTPDAGEQTDNTGGANINIIIGLSIATILVVVILVLAILWLKKGRKQKKGKESMDQKPGQNHLAASSQQFTPVADINVDNKNGIPINFDNIGGGHNNNGQEMMGSEDTLNNSNSNDSGKGPSEAGEATEVASVGVRRIDSGRQRPVSIHSRGGADRRDLGLVIQPSQQPSNQQQQPHHNQQNHYQPMVQQHSQQHQHQPLPSPQSYSSSPSYQHMEPFFSTSSPRISQDYDSEYVDPMTMNPDPNIGLNSSVNISHPFHQQQHHQMQQLHPQQLQQLQLQQQQQYQQQMMMMQQQQQQMPQQDIDNEVFVIDGGGPMLQYPTVVNNGQRHSSTGAIEQIQANAGQFQWHNPQTHVNNMLGLEGMDGDEGMDRWSHSINGVPTSSARQHQHVLARQLSEPMTNPHHQHASSPPQYIHMQSVPNGSHGYSLDV